MKLRKNFFPLSGKLIWLCLKQKRSKIKMKAVSTGKMPNIQACGQEFFQFISQKI
jgi:hypothetical protein